MIKAVLFDLDGTLLNTLDDLADAVNFALSQEGYPTHEVEKYKYFVGSGVHNLLLRALPADCATDEVAQKLRAHFNQYYGAHSQDKTCPYVGILPLLDTLKSRGIKTAVVTNKFHEAAVQLTETYFGDRISLVFGQKEGVPIKPDPAQVQLAMQAFSVEAKDCLFIGDSDVDMLTGVNAGACPVGVLWGFRTGEELVNSGAQYTVLTPNQILELVDSL